MRLLSIIYLYSVVIGQFGHCNQDLINLLLTGRATSNVFDGEMSLGDGMGDLCVRGVDRTCDIGYLTHLEALRYCQVDCSVQTLSISMYVCCVISTNDYLPRYISSIYLSIPTLHLLITIFIKVIIYQSIYLLIYHSFRDHLVPNILHMYSIYHLCIHQSINNLSSINQSIYLSSSIIKVGTYLKIPRFPIWVIGSTSHFTVLFSMNNQVNQESSSERLVSILQRCFKAVDTEECGFIPSSRLLEVRLDDDDDDDNNNDNNDNNDDDDDDDDTFVDLLILFF
jgi:hypothetical protein